MMPLAFMKPGDSGVVKRVGGPDDVKRFLANLGFVDGTKVTVVSEIHGDLIVNVKDSRIAINREMAGRIMV
ncbi:MAG TPA: ferrous iron transport protein A [Candidatus Lachnoclostridium stercorigallinarum]|uniref:Ferrous iron transport protein A n=1 Tax=Candidatus Lachnoclostridium stercorigallinarum TaxID=2838634 RepID=A0A9D2K658_9FIRM|nr:ferrous iron transport protein A [Candidatus Lachnoclostridium stercorigallinarum]